MKIIIALAAGLMATGALAQSSTMQTTTTTTKPTPMPMEHHEMKSSMHHSETHMSGDRAMTAHRHYRKCYTQMRHGHKVRVCRTRHNHM